MCMHVCMCMRACVRVCVCVEPYIGETLSAEGSAQMNKDHKKTRVPENSLYIEVNP